MRKANVDARLSSFMQGKPEAVEAAADTVAAEDTEGDEPMSEAQTEYASIAEKQDSVEADASESTEEANPDVF